MEEIKVSEMLQADSIEKDNAVMIIQDGVNKKASGSIQTATGTSLSLTSVADTCKVTSNSKNLFDEEFRQGNQGYTSVVTRIFSMPNNFYLEAGTYTFSTNLDFTIYDYAFYSNNVPFLQTTTATMISSGYLTTATFTFTLTEGAYIGFTIRKMAETNIVPSDVSNYNFQIEEGSTATEYNPYNTEVGIGVKELQLEVGALSGTNGQPVTTTDRLRSVNFTNIDATKTHIIDAGGSQISVYQYKTDGTFLGSSQGWQNTPYTLIPNAQTGKIKISTPNLNLKIYDLSIDDIKPQVITLTPDETKTAFTYDTETIVEANGSVTIEYNTQSRLLNNDDTTAIKEYIDRETEEIYNTEETKIGTFIGKPLYRKVFAINTTIPSNSTSSSGSVTIFDKSAYNADEVFIKSCRVDNSDNSVSIYVPYAGGQPRYIGISRISNNINVSFYNAFSNENVKITSIIEYTKTTD